MFTNNANINDCLVNRSISTIADINYECSETIHKIYNKYKPICSFR